MKLDVRIILIIISISILACSVSALPAEMANLPVSPTVSTTPILDSQTPATPVCAVVVAYQSLNLRAAPSESARADLRGLKHGDKLTVIARQAGWWQVKTSDGRGGWVRAEYVEVCQ